MQREIKIKDNKHPVSFNFNAWCELGELLGMNLSDMETKFSNPKNFTMSDVRTLAYCGFKEGYRMAGKEFPFTLFDIGDWMSDDIAILSDIMGAFGESMAQMVSKKKGTVLTKPRKKP